MENRNAVWNAYLDEKIRQIKEEEQRLISDERKDEANHQRVKSNIFEVFQTVFNALNQAAPERLKECYEEKMQVIPTAWKESLEKAKEHDDAEKILIEEIKLGAVEEIRAKFEEIWEA